MDGRVYKPRTEEEAKSYIGRLVRSQKNRVKSEPIGLAEPSLRVAVCPAVLGVGRRGQYENRVRI